MNFTMQDQVEHVVGVAMVQVYSLKSDSRNLDRIQFWTIQTTTASWHGNISSGGLKQTNETAKAKST